MKTKYIFIMFIVLAIVQISIPAQMIFKRESVLKTGTAYKFKTQPIDPSDPFKGKYIFLNYDLDSAMANDENWQRHQDVYVSIANDSLGFVKAVSVHAYTPESGDFVKAKVRWFSDSNSVLEFSLPFNEFYMEESKAYDAEVAHRNAQRDSIPNNTYALVYVKNGEAVLDNVFINDIPIAKVVEMQ
ncbi:GDYXXLXY domain-containing protein [uncultured Psychroserpens sp.]|uniref:GDYXXLXY domain-containing protein n=1 Tax=uncultured Psychroserpens sp. TaxID=255436 RepID=UPI00261AE2F4|nr:GDYXXLXY domain-containing protein [uncultured Psychroserpens sp.]